MDSEFFQSIAAGGLVLTANERLSRQLVNRYDHWQMAAGLEVWASPKILSLNAWCRRILHELGLAEAVLTEAQSLRVWEEIIAADVAARGRDLLQIPQAARQARKAFRLLADYLADFREVEADEDPLAFLRWRRGWQERQRAGRWLERADVLPAVTAALEEKRCTVPSVLFLAGFDDLKPSERKLCAVLQAHGCRIGSWEPPVVADAQVSVHGAVDPADEVRTCARWARWHLESNPQSKLGVVVPQLSEYQGLIERIFRAELDPPACLSGEDGPEAFSLSLGRPLAREGVVCAALRLLAASDPLRLEDLGWLLRSPYLGGARSEGLRRARADRTLRERGRNEWRLSALIRALADVPRMAAICAALREAHSDRRRRLAGDWADHFAGLLDDCGWPGERGLSSREYQALDHFRETLGQLASLDRVASPMGRGEALTILNRLAAETIFQAEGGEGRIQVLGTLEAAGFEFDALWILGLHAGALPAPPRPNPFLPLTLQSRLGMPHADAAREQAFAQRLCGRLFSAAREVVASWPGQHDGAPLRPSPLLQGLPAARPSLAPSHDPFHTLRAAPCLLDTLVDDRAAPLPAGRPFSGGTSILTDQALCPFRAFAHFRLHAERLASPDLGLDSLARGNLVHGVLERFWRRVVTRDALLQLDPQGQAELLATAAEETLLQQEQRSRCDLPRRLRVLETRRLVAVATAWLELERRRPGFRVAMIEQRHTVMAGRLQLRTRIDRIDELSDGRLAIIDYKTGQPNSGQWLDARVTEPQLPLYCLDLDDGQIGAVLFARVRHREKECVFRGLAREPEAWPKLSVKAQEKLLAEHGFASFDQVVAHWRRALPALGDAFVDGCAAVDPVDVRQACSYCDLFTLCRIGARIDSAEGGAGGERDDV